MFADSIVQAFQRLVEKRAGGTVVISGRRRCRVAELDALARAAALALDGPAPARTPVVGLMAPNGVGFLASLLALRRAGCVVLLLDDQAPDLEAQRIAGRFGAGSILRCTTAWPRGPQDFLLEAVADPSTEQALHPDTAVIKLTSGSTGVPRGVAASSDALLADDAALTTTMGIGGEDRLLATIPFGHSYGLSSLAVPAQPACSRGCCRGDGVSHGAGLHRSAGPALGPALLAGNAATRHLGRRATRSGRRRAVSRTIRFGRSRVLRGERVRWHLL